MPKISNTNTINRPDARRRLKMLEEAVGRFTSEMLAEKLGVRQSLSLHNDMNWPTFCFRFIPVKTPLQGCHFCLSRDHLRRRLGNSKQ